MGRRVPFMVFALASSLALGACGSVTTSAPSVSTDLPTDSVYQATTSTTASPVDPGHAYLTRFLADTAPLDNQDPNISQAETVQRLRSVISSVQATQWPRNAQADAQAFLSSLEVDINRIEANDQAGAEAEARNHTVPDEQAVFTDLKADT